MVRLAQAQPAVKVTMLGLGSDSGCIRVNTGARVTWPQHRPWWEHELESSFSPEFLLTQLAGQGWTRAPKGSVEPEEPDRRRG